VYGVIEVWRVARVTAACPVIVSVCRLTKPGQASGGDDVERVPNRKGAANVQLLYVWSTDMSLDSVSSSKPPLKSRSKAKAKPDKDRIEARRLGRERRLAARREFFLNIKELPDDACLLVPEWAALNCKSERQARRILASGDGPTITKLSAKRRGITVRHNREWQERRALTR
jgi:hypothetical protein